LRVFYAFDPHRAAILLIGGDKTGQDDFYTRLIPLADRLYDEHLAEITTEKTRKQDDGGQALTRPVAPQPLGRRTRGG